VSSAPLPGPPAGMRSGDATHPELPHDVVVVIGPTTRRLTAPNPGPMTGPGTNTYLVGDERSVVVIDPGPDDAGHVAAIVAAVGPARATIALTHTHPDHWPAAVALAEILDAPVAAYGPGDADGLVLDTLLRDGDRVGQLVAVHTPGHASNHLCFELTGPGGRWLFTGDHVMGGSTVVISPPDGDMTTYVASLRLVLALGVDVIAPGHGEVVEDPDELVTALIAHRQARESQLLDLVRRHGPISVTDLTALAYPDVIEALRLRARASAWAHLRALHADGFVGSTAFDDPDGVWSVSVCG